MPSQSPVSYTHLDVYKRQAYVELHVEQGLALALDPDGEPDLIDPARAVAIGTEIWPHGRWEIDLFGEANHAGTTRLEDRLDAMLQFAAVVASARMLSLIHISMCIRDSCWPVTLPSSAKCSRSRAKMVNT